MKASVLELLAEANVQLTKEGHEIYSRAEVIQLINNLRNQIGDLPDQPIMNEEIVNQLRKVINNFDFEFSYDLTHDAKIVASVDNSEELAEEILDLIVYELN